MSPVWVLISSRCRQQVHRLSPRPFRRAGFFLYTRYYISMNEEDIKQKLTEEEYKVLREGATERPFTGELLHEERDGSFSCKVCSQTLFSSDAKFDSGTGWPSFDKAVEGGVIEKEDISLGMRRVEVLCSRCGSHLGHVFPDGPTKTGMRYCINSVCLGFEEVGENRDKTE